MDTVTITTGGMSVGWWIQLALTDDGDLRWARIGALIAPVVLGDMCRAVRVHVGNRKWWVRIAPHLAFPVCDVDPVLRTPAALRG